MAEKEASLIATNKKINRSAEAQANSELQVGVEGEAVTPTPKKKRKRKRRNPFAVFFYTLFTLVVAVGCIGVMVGCCAAVWMVKYAVETGSERDIVLSETELSQSSVVYVWNDSESQWVASDVFKSSDSHRIWVDLNDIPVDLQNAVIAIEDKDFLTEPGVNFPRTIAAFVNAYVPLVRLFSSDQGASTLEQQLIKNITGDAEQGGLEGAKRKLREIFLALSMDKKYSKEEILQAYLNTISFTSTLQGVEAASQAYFGKSVSECTLAECATLASITKSPVSYNPTRNPENLLKRRNDVLYFMQVQGYITPEQEEAAAAEPLVLAESEEVSYNDGVTSYYNDALFEQLTKDIIAKETANGNPITEEEAQRILFTKGLQIYSNEDIRLQSIMEDIMVNDDGTYFPAYWVEEKVQELQSTDIPVYNGDGSLKTSEENGVTYYYRSVRTQSGMACLDYNGRVVALVGGVGQKVASRSLNRAFSVPRQTGSAIKPLGAYSLGIEYNLINFSTALNDSPLYTAEEKIVENGYGGWRDWPVNATNRYTYEPTTIAYALTWSLNTIAARVGNMVGVEPMYTQMVNALHMSYLNESDKALAPLVLGGQNQGVTPLEMAAAFTIFNNGTYTTPCLYSQVLTANGEVYLDNSEPMRNEALSPSTATIMTRILERVTSYGTAGGTVASNTPTAGKTGTTTDNKDLWFVGYTPYYSCAVWYGYDGHQEIPSGEGGRGARLAWKEFINRAQAGYEWKDFYYDSSVITRAFCTTCGGLAGENSEKTETGYYTSDNLPEACICQPADKTKS